MKNTMVARAASLKALIAVFALLLTLARQADATPLPPDADEGITKHDEAIELLKKSEFDRAIELENRMLEENPADLTAYFLLTIAYLGKDDEKKAVEQAQKVKDIAPAFVAEIYNSMGRYYHIKKRYHKALVYFDESLKIKDDPDIFKQVAMIYLNQGLLEKAKGYYMKLLNYNPDYVGLSRIYLALEDFENAKAYAKKAVAEDEKAAAAYLVLGSSYLLTGNIKLAQANFSVLKELSPEFILSGYFLGVINVIKADYEQALEDFETVLNSSPDLKELHINTAIIWHLKGNLANAKKAAMKAIETEPNDPVAHICLGSIYLSERELDLAQAEFKKAGDIWPDFELPSFKIGNYFSPGLISENAEFTLANMLFRIGLYREAVSVIERNGERKDSRNPFFMLLKARAQAKAGRTGTAKDIYLSISTRHPELVTSYMELGEIAAGNAQMDKAILFFKKAEKLAPEMMTIKMRIADIEQKTGNASKAIEEYRDTISKFPDSPEPYKRMANALAKESRYTEALDYAKEGHSLDPYSPEAKDLLGWIHYKLGDFEEALNSYDGLAEANDPRIYYHLGLVYYKLNMKKEAANAIEKSLNMSDEFEGSESAKAMLRSLNGF